MKKNKKGASEIISYVIIILITVIVVGIIVTKLNLLVQKNNLEKDLQESRYYIELIENKVYEVLESPIGSITSLDIDLENKNLEINEKKIEITHQLDKKIKKLKVVEARIYTKEENQKISIGLEIKDFEIENKLNAQNTRITLYIKKVDKNKVSIQRDLDLGIPEKPEKERP